MRSRNLAASAGALLLLGASIANAKHSHQHLDVLHPRHHLHPLQHRSQSQAGESGIALRAPEKRGGKGGQCRFPDDAGLVAVTPDAENAGWAMSPDQPCLPDSYCPYACPSGQVMMQWDPTATSYSYPKSMNGGLYCDKDGNIEKPFPDRPYCEDAKNGIGALNKAGGAVSFCQTVLPGNEAMLIPTHVEDWVELACPGTDYWLGTAAHYYINPPGVGCDEACVWGTKDNPVGNWSPYVAGGNVKNGQAFIKLGWNPIYLEEATPFRDVMPDWGVKIECDGEGCNGLPCAIDPAVNKVNEMVGGSTTGAGGASFCVVTVPEGVNANFVVFGGSEGSGDDSAKGGDSAKGKPSAASPVPASQSTGAVRSSAAPSPSPLPYSPSDSSLSDSASSGDESSENISSPGDEDVPPSDDLDTPPVHQARGPDSKSASTPLHAPLEFFERTNSTNSTIAPGTPSVTPSISQTSPTVAVFSGGASTERITVGSVLLSSLMVLTTLTLSN